MSLIIENNVVKKYISDASETTIIIPEGIEKIGFCAFNGAKNIQEIILPHSLKEICARAFKNCENLREISLPNSIKRLGRGAFMGCRSLEKVTISSSLTQLERAVFSDCGLKSVDIPSRVRAITREAFARCSQLEQVSFNEGLVSIEEAAFEDCIRLNNLVFPQTLKHIWYDAFWNCESLSKIDFYNRPEDLDDEDAFNKDMLDCRWVSQKVRDITLNESVDITDPCYKRVVGYRTYRLNAIPVVSGKYTCRVWLDDDNIAKVGLYLNDQFVETTAMEHIGDITVDSGLAGFFYNKPDYYDWEWQEICNYIQKKGGYAWLTEDGLFTNSGYGDGLYEVFAALDSDKRAYAFEISYIEYFDDQVQCKFIK